MDRHQSALLDDGSNASWHSGNGTCNPGSVMAGRSPGAQHVHDRVIAELAVVLAETYPASCVHCNPGVSKCFGVAGQFPDVVVCHYGELGEGVHAFEVETLQSLSKWSAVAWKEWLGLGHPLTIVVPVALHTTAKSILLESELTQIEVMAYRCTLSGQIRFEPQHTSTVTRLQSS